MLYVWWLYFNSMKYLKSINIDLLLLQTMLNIYIRRSQHLRECEKEETLQIQFRHKW